MKMNPDGTSQEQTHINIYMVVHSDEIMNYSFGSKVDRDKVIWKLDVYIERQLFGWLGLACYNATPICNQCIDSHVRSKCITLYIRTAVSSLREHQNSQPAELLIKSL